jgi:hypothetical protein
LETDRGAVLTVRAHLAGAIDFRQARLRDPNWWRLVNAVIRAMTADRDAEILRAAYAFQCALVDNGNLTDDSFKTAQARTKETFNDLVNAIQPWAARTTGEVKKTEIAGMVETYKRLIGDPGDPKFRDRMLASIEKNRLERERPSPEDEETRVARLLDEAERRRRGRRR